MPSPYYPFMSLTGRVIFFPSRAKEAKKKKKKKDAWSQVSPSPVKLATCTDFFELLSTFCNNLPPSGTTWFAANYSRVVKRSQHRYSTCFGSNTAISCTCFCSLYPYLRFGFKVVTLAILINVFLKVLQLVLSLHQLEYYIILKG